MGGRECSIKRQKKAATNSFTKGLLLSPCYSRKAAMQQNNKKARDKETTGARESEDAAGFAWLGQLSMFIAVHVEHMSPYTGNAEPARDLARSKRSSGTETQHGRILDPPLN